MNNKIKELLNNSKKIAIFSHIHPDADALCSSFALKNLIVNNYDYKFIDVFIDGQIGELYEPILRNEVVNPKPYANYDLAFVLDCPNLNRIGKYKELVENIPIIVNIDHHETNEKFGTENFVSSTVSSTCELIYLIACGQELELNNLIAKELYQGILTDTNCFTSLTMTSRTYKVISELTQYKYDADVIKEYYFKNNTIPKTKLLTKALQSLKFYCNERFTTMKLNHETLEKVGASFEDTLGIIDNSININDVEASAILIERNKNDVYCSLRSKGRVNVGQIAKNFNGGGSEKIAAFQSNEDIKEIEGELVKQVMPMLPENSNEDKLIF